MEVNAGNEGTGGNTGNEGMVMVYDLGVLQVLLWRRIRAKMPSKLLLKVYIVT